MSEAIAKEKRNGQRCSDSHHSIEGSNSISLGLLAVMMFLNGCSAAGPQVRSYVGPTGETVNTVRCTREPTACFETASDTCSGGSYRVISSYRNAGGLYADVFPGPVTWYTMDIVCGPADGRLPEFPLRGEEPSMPDSSPTYNTTCREVGGALKCKTS